MILFLSIIIGFFHIGYNRKWAEPSGFNYLDSSMQDFTINSISLTFFLIFPTAYLTLSNNIIISLILMNISAGLMCFELYYTFSMLLNSNGVINSLLIGWEAHLNSDRLYQIEKDFACCGFHFRYQFFGDKCNISEWPCLLPIANKLIPSVVKSGYYFLAQAIFHLCATICFFLLARKETIISEEAESFLKPNSNQNIDRFN